MERCDLAQVLRKWQRLAPELRSNPVLLSTSRRFLVSESRGHAVAPLLANYELPIFARCGILAGWRVGWSGWVVRVKTYAGFRRKSET
jgi:hypothetical protein